LARQRDEGEIPGDPRRTCVVTRQAHDPARMIRFVAAPDGSVLPDLRRKLPGRGVWVTGQRSIVARAIARKAFARGLKRPVTVPPDLAETVAQLLRRDALQALALANKAGAALFGFNQVEPAAVSRQLAVLLHAVEAAPDGVRKLAQALRRGAGVGEITTIVVKDFTEDELGLAFGRPHVIHAGLVAGPGSDGFRLRWHRYRSYLDDEPPLETGVPEPGLPLVSSASREADPSPDAAFSAQAEPFVRPHAGLPDESPTVTRHDDSANRRNVADRIDLNDDPKPAGQTAE
jgi:predicted RNA-binding protein YlxR (DUF448 family)